MELVSDHDIKSISMSEFLPAVAAFTPPSYNKTYLYEMLALALTAELNGYMQPFIVCVLSNTIPE